MSDEENDQLEAGVEECYAYWFDLWGADELPRYYRVWKGSIRRYLREGFSPFDVKEAMDIAVERKGLTAASTRYFGGIMRQKLAERDREATA